MDRKFLTSTPDWRSTGCQRRLRAFVNQFESCLTSIPASLASSSFSSSLGYGWAKCSGENIHAFSTFLASGWSVPRRVPFLRLCAADFSCCCCCICCWEDISSSSALLAAGVALSSSYEVLENDGSRSSRAGARCAEMANCSPGSGFWPGWATSRARACP